MQKSISIYFPVSLIFILFFSRLIPHPPNFTPIITTAILSTFFFRKLYLSLIVILIAMLLSDIFIGFYKNMFFVYLSLFLIVLIFFKYGKKINSKNLFIFSFFGSLIFFIISNFGVWVLSDMYEKNINGLIYCYVLAIPFFLNTFFSTILFSYSAYYVNYLYTKKVVSRA